MTTINYSAVSSQLHTIGDYLRFATSQFNQADLFFGHGSDNAWDEAVILVMHSLFLPDELTEHVIACRLTDDEKQSVLTIIDQRVSEGLPAAYITNQAYFANLPFYVDQRVLVPRSPIAELILNLFEPYISTDNPPARILDLCTGSGCIAIACATVFPDAEVDALDLSIDALNVAQINIESHGLNDRVTPIQSDIFSEVSQQQYDLIVTNPPYVDQDDVDSLPMEYQHEPAMGLGCGDDGLDIVRKILAQSYKQLNEGGILICEVGNSQIHLESVYPEIPFTWITFKQGGHGVFMLSKAQLQQFSAIFEQRERKS